MSMSIDASYDQWIDSISTTLTQGQIKTVAAINTQPVSTYWQIGRHIVEFEPQGKTSTEYGKQLLSNLSRDLKLKHGKGFGLSNIKRFRQFYLADKIGATLSHQLSWSHHVELLKISNETERAFYTRQLFDGHWISRSDIRGATTWVKIMDRQSLWLVT